MFASFESRFIDAGGLRLHYLDYGTAGLPPMLCIHGGGVTGAGACECRSAAVTGAPSNYGMLLA